MNLDRSTTQGLPRVGKGHAGGGPIGQHGWDGAAGAGGTGFLSVLATLDATDVMGPLDAATAPVSLPGGADSLPLAIAVEPALTDGAQVMPDAGWQVDTAALLAHLSQSAQWAPAPDTAVSSIETGGLTQSVALNLVSGVRADTSGQPPRVALSAPASPSAATPQLAIPVVLSNAQAGMPSRIEVDVAPSPSGFQQGVGHEASELEMEPPLPDSVPLRASALGMLPQVEKAVKSSDAASMTFSGSNAAVVDDTKAIRWESAQALTQGLTPHAEVDVAKPAVAPGGFAQTATDTKARQGLVGPEVAAQAVAGPSATVLMAVPEGLARKTDRIGGRSSESHTGSTVAGHWGAYALVSGRPVEASSAMQHGTLPSPEMMVAEQVSYWIAGRVQNAELRLDVFGRTPVEVSISMQGNEAQVEFRTDQPEIRQVLEGAVAHLKDLLKDEGLSLAGVFVGSSGQRRQDAQPSPGPSGESGMRQARVEVPLATATGLSSGQRPVAGRSVDLFV